MSNSFMLITLLAKLSSSRVASFSGESSRIREWYILLAIRYVQVNLTVFSSMDLWISGGMVGGR